MCVVNNALLRALLLICMHLMWFSTNSQTPPPQFGKTFNGQVPAPAETPIHGLLLKDLAASIGTILQDISNRELGVPVMQDMYDSLNFVPVMENGEERVQKIADKISTKLTEVFHILNNSKELIERRYSEMVNTDQLMSVVFPCSFVPSTYLWETYSKFFVINDSALTSYVQYMPSMPRQSAEFNLSQVFSQYLTGTSHRSAGIKQIYFLSSTDTTSSFSGHEKHCTLYDNTPIWKEYISRVNVGVKNLIILLEHGNALSGHQLYLAKAMAKSLIQMLNAEDMVSIIALAATHSTPFMVDQCSSAFSNDSTFVPASEFNKNRFYNFIDSLTKSKEVTNHSYGFQQAFATIRTYSAQISEPGSFLLVYISRGLLSSLAEARTVLQTIAMEGADLLSPVVVCTCPVIDDTKPLMYEKHFLTDVAMLNFSKHNLDVNDSLSENFLERGIVQVINSVYNLGLVSARFFTTILDPWLPLDPAVKISTPECDPVSKEVTITISVGCGGKQSMGVLGIDLYLNYLAEDILYLGSHPKDDYAFLINMDGTTIMHRSYNQPNFCLENSEIVDISLLEKGATFNETRKMILTKSSGSLNSTNEKNQTVTYTWRHVQEWYVVVLVSIERTNLTKKLGRVNLPQDVEILHHRLDLLPPYSVCRHLRQIGTLASGVLYFSADCFESPYSQLRTNWGFEIPSSAVEHYMAYLKDPTGLLTNPGFKPEVRNEVLSLMYMMTYLKRQQIGGPLRQNAVRRYVSSSGGVFQMYPGTTIQPGLEPTRRLWYQRAIEHPGRVILTPPYLDAGGAGYIVTLSHTVYVGKHDSMHSTKDAIVAVMGIDLTLGYFYKLLVQQMPFCTQTNVKCFLMDDKGYLISHPSLVDPLGKGPIEQTHIVNKESIVANDILNQKYFVKKILCNNFIDGTMQRYYQFNTSYVGTIRNMIHGEHCSKYQISPLPGTNLFLGVVNSTCENSATFCPCSMVDRLCLNCNRMEQNECECPCECPMNLHKQTCPNANTTFLANPTCPIMIYEHMTTIPTLNPKLATLKPCTNFHCESYTTHDSCLGVVGCEWCQIDLDGETPLGAPFCTSLAACFGGVLGSINPYGDPAVDPITSGDLLGSTYSAIGPVAGSLVVMCLILSLIIYFYRQNATPLVNDEMYLESVPEQGQGQIAAMRMSHLEMNDLNEERDGYRDMLMAYNLEAVSPYRLSAGYRRPHTTGDSDHGYSTMTPHEESEHLSVALVEPLLTLNDEATLSDVGSNSTCISSSSPQSCADVPGATSLNQHCLLVPVIVHRDMETT